MIFALGMLIVQEGLVFLVDVHALGAPRLGPLRVDDLWLYLGPIQLQPSEFGKLALALWGAGVLARLGPAEKRLRDFSRSLLPGVGLMLLLVGYSDLGTMICLVILVIGLLYAGGVRMRVFGWLVGGALVAVMLLVLVQPYRVVRLTGFLHSPAACDVQRTEDPCYQALEGRYAIADGGWFGVGLGQGHLKWGRLPNGHNDFIFAIIAEELGVIGCFVVLALLAVLAYTGLRIARRVTDPYRRIVATGITAWLVGQAAINIGGVVGLLPITGLPLPFISDGGSALVVVLGAVGVLASFARAEPDAARALHARPPDRWVRLLWAPLPPLPRAERADGDAPARPSGPRAVRSTPPRSPRTSGAAASGGLPRGSGSSGRGSAGRAGSGSSGRGGSGSSGKSGVEPGRNGIGRAGTDRKEQPGRSARGSGGARGRTERRG